MRHDALKVLLTALLFSALVLARPTLTPAPFRVKDEGSFLTTRPSVNFTGAGVTCTDDSGNNTSVCDIPGGSASPLTTKGDLYTYTTVDARLAVGTDGYCLKANSATSTGLEWNTCAATSAYATVQDEGTPLTQRSTLNFTGAGVSCVDNAGSTRTDCTISGGSTYTTRLELGVNGAGGAAVTTGAKGRKTFSITGTIQRWRLVADQSTTTTLDIWKTNAAIPTNANSITASAKPSLTTAQYNTSATLTGWTTSVSAGDVFILEVESNDNATYLALELEISVP